MKKCAVTMLAAMTVALFAATAGYAICSVGDAKISAQCDPAERCAIAGVAARGGAVRTADSALHIKPSHTDLSTEPAKAKKILRGKKCACTEKHKTVTDAHVGVSAREYAVKTADFAKRTKLSQTVSPTTAETGADGAKSGTAKVDSVLAEAYGEVIEEGKTDRVVLYGRHPNKGFFTENIYIEVRDGATDRLILTVKPPSDAGYKPTLMIGKFTDSACEQIFLNVDSGGSGGFMYSYVYATEGGKAKTLWNYAAFKNDYTAYYLDHYRFRVENAVDGTRYTEDISARSKEYLDAIYSENGNLKKPVSGYVSGVNSVFPYWNPISERYGLLVGQSVWGLYHADGFGWIQHLMRWEDKGFKCDLTTFNLYGTLENSQ